jgi:DNA ligase (NAD+)
VIKSIAKIFAHTFGKQPDDERVFHPFQTCPECGTRLWAESGAAAQNWTCPNADCPAEIRKQLEHWCSAAAMDIPGGDAAMISKLTGKGLVNDVAELYRLQLGEIAAVEGLTRESAHAFIDAIDASRKRDAWRLLFGLSIPRLATEDAKTLCGQFRSVDNIFAASADRLMRAGVSEAVAREIVKWHSQSLNRKLVKHLFKAGLNFKA